MRIRIALLLLATLVSPAAAETFKGTCDIRFLATSNLHDFEGTARCQPFELRVESGPNGRPVIHRTEIAVPVDGMNTRNEDRDGQMREMFESGKHPRIDAVLPEVDPEAVRKEARAGGSGKGAAEFTLRIRGVEKPLRAVITNLRERPGLVTFDAEFPVSLKEFRLKAPRAVFGLVRVADGVTVKAAFRLEAAPPK